MTHSVRGRMIKLGILFCTIPLLLQSTGKSTYALAKVKSKPVSKINIDSRYTRNHNIKALYTVTPVNFDNFADGAGKDFSLLKYGSQKHIEECSEQLLKIIWKDHADEISANPDQWLIVSPATFSLPTSAVLVSEAIERQLLRKYGVRINKISLKRRKTNSVDFGSLTNLADRQSHIKNNFFFEGPSLAGKKLLFIEDALVSGTHYQESQRALVEEGKANHKDIFAYFLVNVEQSGIESSDYSLESKINQIMMAADTPERLLPILRDKSNQITPRMLKYVFKSQSRTTYYCLNLNYESLARIYQASLTDGFNFKNDFKENVSSIGVCTEHKLADEKKLMGVEDLHKVNARTVKKIIGKKVYNHPGFSEKISLATMYSLLKFGDTHAIKYFAGQISRRIKSKFGKSGRFPKQNWAIITTGYAGTPGAASYLTKEIAEILKLKLIDSSRKSTPTVSYSNLSGAAERRLVVENQFIFKGKVPGNLIYIDDAIASGAHVREYGKIAKQHKARLHPFVILDIESADCSLEAQINSNIVEMTGIKGFAEVINNPDTPVLLRTLKTILSFSDSQTEEIFRRLGVKKSEQIYQAMIKEGFNKKKNLANRFAQISRILTDLKARSLKFTHHNLESSDGKSHGVRSLIHSLMSGNVAARKALKSKFEQKLIKVVGNDLRSNPQNYVLASAPFYFKPNAMYYLLNDISNDLGIPTVDVRSKSHFSSNDLHDQSVSSAQLFFGNQEKVQGKTILYLDTIHSTGERLSGINRLCNTHSCGGVISISANKPNSQQASSEFVLDLAAANRLKAANLISVFKDPESSFVAEVVHRILTLDAKSFDQVVNSLSTSQIFELVNSAGYDLLNLSKAHQVNFETLNQKALELHEQQNISHISLEKIQPRLMVIDYDKTLAPTLSHPDKSTMKSLKRYLSKGGYLCIISMQPIGKRGLTETFYEPFKLYLESLNKSDLLRNVWLLPSAGSSAYRPDENLRINIDQPIYRVGLLPDEFKQLSKVVAETVAGVAHKIYYRDTYISMHFIDESQKLIGLEKLNSVFGANKRFEVIESIVRHPTKKVLHVRPVDLSKQMGKSFALEVIRKEINQKSGSRLLNEEIVTAGDKMGALSGQTSDSDLFMYGAANFALGIDAKPGARKELLNTYNDGFCKWLSSVTH